MHVALINWQQALAQANYDEQVGIRIAKLVGDEQFSTYVTIIDPGKKVKPHYHRQGNEHYHIVSGQGVVNLIDNITQQQSEFVVNSGESFVVAANVVHQLANNGQQPLLLMFSCPAQHLADDRYLTEL